MYDGFAATYYGYLYFFTLAWADAQHLARARRGAHGAGRDGPDARATHAPCAEEHAATADAQTIRRKPIRFGGAFDLCAAAALLAAFRGVHRAASCESRRDGRRRIAPRRRRGNPSRMPTPTAHTARCSPFTTQLLLSPQFTVVIAHTRHFGRARLAAYQPPCLSQRLSRNAQPSCRRRSSHSAPRSSSPPSSPFSST